MCFLNFSTDVFIVSLCVSLSDCRVCYVSLKRRAKGGCELKAIVSSGVRTGFCFNIRADDES